MRFDWRRPTTCVLLLLILAGPAFAQPTKFQEAPVLAEQVKAGKLPPVEKRLPSDPLVVPVVERAGQFSMAWAGSHTRRGLGLLGEISKKPFRGPRSEPAQ